jgi:hypothetical protein
MEPRVLVPDRCYLVRMTMADDGSQVETIVRYLGVLVENDQPVFEGYEQAADGREVEFMHVIHEIKEG